MFGLADLSSHPDARMEDPAAVLPDPIAELPNPEPGAHQPGQVPGRATPDTHPQHFMEAKIRHPAGPWSPNTGVGVLAQNGDAPVQMHLRDPFASMESRGSIKPQARPQKPGPDPVPVVVVPPKTDSNYRVVSFTQGPMPVGDTAAQFLGRDLKRQRALLVNEGAAPIRVGFTPQLTQNSGFYVAAGGTCEVKTGQEVYVIDAVAGTPSTVSAMVEAGQSGPVARRRELVV